MPLTSHVTVVSCAPVTTARNACVPASGTVAADGDTETLTVEIIVTGTEAAFEGSASGVAVICTVAGDGANVGAAYTPLGEIVPQVAPAQPKPETVQVIARLGLELATGIKVAVKLAVAEVFTVAGPATVSENELMIVIAAVTLFDGSATLMALMEALGGVVRICGAVYIPVGSTVPQAAPTHPLPEIIQLIARSGLPAEFTVAANGHVAPNSTRTVGGKREIEISLVTVTTAAALFELSATLVARTLTEPEEGRSPGAV